MTDTLTWATTLDALRRRRCNAVREHRPGYMWHGRCELRAGHDGDHALERGFDTPRWSTDWTR